MYRASLARASLISVMLFASLLFSSCNAPPTPAACASWQIVPGPNPGNIADQLSDIFAVSSENIWVAGSVTDTATGADSSTLVEHWNGKAWAVIPSGPETDRYLTRIAGSAANDIWAAGDGYGSFLEHWDGHAWSAVDTPVVPQAVYSYRYIGVSVLSPTDAWVVGSAASRNFSAGGENSLALTAHWDGHIWSVVPNPDLHADLNGTVLFDVAALAPNNVWAVGNTSARSKSQLALIEHWDGKVWRVISNPQPQGTADVTSAASFMSLSARAPNDLWAAGYYELAGVLHYLVERWDGHTWNVMPAPAPGKKIAILHQIVAVSDQNVWAIDTDGALFHWNGSVWTSSSLPNADQNGYEASSIAALPNGQLWLAGTARNPTGPGPRTLIARSCS